MSIVKIQRSFRTRQAVVAKVAAQEEERRVSDKSSSAGVLHHASMDASDIAKLRLERQELLVAAGVGPSGTLVFEPGKRVQALHSGPLNYGQYNMQRDFLGDDPVPMWARLYRGQLHPYEPTRVVWDSIMLLLVCWSCLFDPYKAAFLEVRHSYIVYTCRRLIDLSLIAGVLVPVGLGHRRILLGRYPALVLDRLRDGGRCRCRLPAE